MGASNSARAKRCRLASGARSGSVSCPCSTLCLFSDASDAVSAGCIGSGSGPGSGSSGSGLGGLSLRPSHVVVELHGFLQGVDGTEMNSPSTTLPNSFNLHLEPPPTGPSNVVIAGYTDRLALQLLGLGPDMLSRGVVVFPRARLRLSLGRAECELEPRAVVS